MPKIIVLPHEELSPEGAVLQVDAGGQQIRRAIEYAPTDRLIVQTD